MNIIIAPHATHVDTIICNVDTDINIECKENSRATVYVQHVSGAVSCTAHVAHDAQLQLVFVGADIAHGSLQCTVGLHGSGAHAALVGAYYLHSTNALAITTRQEHNAPHTTSTLRMRKIVRDQAKTTYNGMIYIAPNAQHSDAMQEDKVLVDGTRTTTESVPAIEVLHNDVQCAHGSAIGQIDADQLLYMRARGLTKDQAQALVYRGFFDTVLATINDKSLKHEAYKTVSAAL